MMEVGRRELFALAFQLTDDPDAEGSALNRASWGYLQMWVAGRNLTSGIAADGTSIDRAECPLLPIVAWFVDRWDALFHEERLPSDYEAISSAQWHSRVLQSAKDDDAAFDELMDERLAWWNNHGLGSALPDYRIPDLHIRRRDKHVELSWDDSEWRAVASGVQLSFQPGVVTLTIDFVCSTVSDWCRAVLRDVAATADVSQLMSRLNALASSERTLPRLLLAAGMSKLSAAADRLRKLAGVEDGAVEDTIKQLVGLGSGSPARLYATLTVPVLLFRSARPSLSEGDLHALIRLSSDAARGSSTLELDLRSPRPCPLDNRASTMDGYDLAREVRAKLKIPMTEPLTGVRDLESVLLSTLGVAVLDVTLEDRGVEGVAIWSPGRIPLIAVNTGGLFSGTQWGRRMTLAHEVCHLLSDGSEDVGVGIVSNSWAPRLLERRASAFAAMLLAPSEALRAVLGGDNSARWHVRDLQRAMSVLGIGATTLCRQLQNLSWISKEESEAWLERLASS